MISRIVVAICSVAILLGCNTKPEGGNIEDSAPSGELSVAYLKSLCAGDHYRITSDCVIRGVIVANDWLGELNKSIVVVDRSGGVEVAIDSRNIAKILPIYSEVEILCNGLMLARVGGKIELGSPSDGDFPIANIEEGMIDHYIRVVGVCEDFEPVTKRFSEIGVADIGAIIRFDNVRVCDEEKGLSWCDIVDNEAVTTYRTFIDSDGVSFPIRTLSSCRYGTSEIPTKNISVAGIIDYSDNRYFLRIANKSIR